MMFEDVFIAVYTHECKSYCDKKFYKNLLKSKIGNATVGIVDNSLGMEYYNRLLKAYGKKARIFHIDVSREDKASQFQRNVTESLLFLRDLFLKGDYKYFVILESDVIPKDPKWLYYFMEVVDGADIIGGIYYEGFHAPELWKGEPRLVPTHHVLSGCTLYKRYIIERFPFRWSYENIGAFPDAWICHDCNKNRSPEIARLANYTKIVCDHLHASGGGRGHDKVN